MSNSQRDTQFQGFAKALLEEMVSQQSLYPNTDDPQPCRMIIARRAYDLVEHAIEHMRPYIYGEQVAGQESVGDVPDMTDLPKEQDEP